MHKVRMSFHSKGDGTIMANQGGEYGTALQAASYKGNLDIVKLLLEKGGDPNAQGGSVFPFQGRYHWNGKSRWQIWDSPPSSLNSEKSGYCEAAS
jgi:ankyrin repeat protein